MSKLNDVKEHRKQLSPFMDVPPKWETYIYMWKKFGSTEIRLIVEFILNDFEETKRILFMYREGQQYFKVKIDPEELEPNSIVILKGDTVCVSEHLCFGYWGGDEFYVSLK